MTAISCISAMACNPDDIISEWWNWSSWCSSSSSSEDIAGTNMECSNECWWSCGRGDDNDDREDRDCDCDDQSIRGSRTTVGTDHVLLFIFVLQLYSSFVSSCWRRCLRVLDWWWTRWLLRWDDVAWLRLTVDRDSILLLMCCLCWLWLDSDFPRHRDRQYLCSTFFITPLWGWLTRECIIFEIADG